MLRHANNINHPRTLFYGRYVNARIALSLIIVFTVALLADANTGLLVGTVTTLAGTASTATTGGYANGVGTSAMFNSPSGVGFGPNASYVVVFDIQNNVARRVDTASAVVTTLAGSGTFGRGDGTSTQAKFTCASPNGIAVDAGGKMALVPDRGAFGIRRIDLQSLVVTTIAGNIPFTVVDGYWTGASFAGPASVALDAGAAFALITDTDTIMVSLIRRVNLTTGLVTTVAGKNGVVGFVDGQGSAAAFDRPYAISMDGAGSFALIADFTNHAVRSFHVASRVVTTLAGSGAAGYLDGYGPLAKFNGPQSVAVDAAGALAIVADTYNLLIRRVNVSTGLVTTLAGSFGRPYSVDGVGTSAGFSYPSNIAIDVAGTVGIIVDQDANLLRLITLVPPASPTASVSSSATPPSSASSTIGPQSSDIGTVTVSTLAGFGTQEYADGTGTLAMINGPVGIAFGPNASYALVTDLSYRVRRIEVSSALVTTIAGSGTFGVSNGIGTGVSFLFSIYGGIAVDTGGTMALVADSTSTIRRIDLKSLVVTTVAGSRPSVADGYGTAATFAGPNGIALDAIASFALVADSDIATNNFIRYINLTTWRVTTICGNGGRVGYADGQGTSAILNVPVGIAMDSIGSFAVIADYRNSVVRKLCVSSQVVTTLAGNGSVGASDGYGSQARFRQPSSVALDSAGSVAVVVDTYNHILRRINVSTGYVTTLAGMLGSQGAVDGVGTSVLFCYPAYVAIDAAGKVALVADRYSNRVRRVVLVPVASPTSSGSATSTPSFSLMPPSLTPASTSSSSATQTSSPNPFSLTLLSSDPSALAPALSDSLSPVTLQMWLSRCPSAADAARLSGAAVSCHTDALASTAVFVELQAAPGFHPVLAGTCDPSDAAPPMLQPSVRVGGRFRLLQPVSVTLVCGIIDLMAGSQLARATLPLQVRPTLWPLFADVILVSAQGMLRSAQLAYSVNATESLLAAASAFLANGTSSVESQPSLSWALGSPSVVLAAAIAVWSKNVSSADLTRPFTLTLSGESRVVLRGSSGLRSFSPGSNVSLGGVPCNLSAVSEDGAWAVLDTPSALALCGSVTRDCGYRSLLVSTVPFDESLGASLSCPPFCPGAVTGSVVPVATGRGVFALGVNPPLSQNQSGLPALLPSLSSSTLGIYYAVSCAQTGVWTDPDSGACVDPSSPASYGCAYGGGFGCVACPIGALCPGGSRLWPRVGYWTSSDAAAAVAPCAPPDAFAKCQGWDISAGAVLCGPPYLAGSYLCGACASGYYPWGDGSCVSCPSVASAWERYRGLTALLLGAVGAACAVGLVLLTLVHTVGGTFWGSSRRLLDLVQWAIVALQTVSQAAPVSAASLPTFLGTLFRGLAVLRVEGLLLASGCTGEYAFQTDVGVMGTALALTAIAAAAAVAAASGIAPPTVRGWLYPLGSISLRAALLLYPVAARDALVLIDCTSVSLTPAAAAGLDGGPPLYQPQTASAAAAFGTVTLQVLSSNPLYVCWAPGGSQRPAGVLAAFVVAVFVIGLPLVSLAAVWQHARQRARAAPLLAKAPVIAGVEYAQSVGKYAVQDEEPPPPPLLAPFLSDYRTRSWYTRHADLALTLLLAALQAFLPHPVTPAAIVCKALFICVGALTLAAHAIFARPFNTQNAWKGPVRAALLCLTAACASINAWAAAVDAGAASASVGALSACAALVIALFCGALLLLVSGISRATLRGIREEQAAIEARLAQAKAAQSLVERRRGKGHDRSAVLNGADYISALAGAGLADEAEDGTFDCVNPVRAADPAIVQMPSASAGDHVITEPIGDTREPSNRVVSRRLASQTESGSAGHFRSRSGSFWAGLGGAWDAAATVGFRAVPSRRRQ